MSNRVRDIYTKLLSSDKYDNDTKTALSHRILACINREQEQLDDNLFLRVDDLEDSENMRIVIWSNIDLPHNQTVKDEKSFTDEELLEFLRERMLKETQVATRGMKP